MKYEVKLVPLELGVGSNQAMLDGYYAEGWRFVGALITQPMAVLERPVADAPAVSAAMQPANTPQADQPRQAAPQAQSKFVHPIKGRR